MSIDDLRIAVTILSFVSFIGVVGWACSQRNRGRFDEAARLPFKGDEQGERP
jgi:cytochrome c oxidase cbb3-type subunit 4